MTNRPTLDACEFCLALAFRILNIKFTVKVCEQQNHFFPLKFVLFVISNFRRTLYKVNKCIGVHCIVSDVITKNFMSFFLNNVVMITLFMPIFKAFQRLLQSFAGCCFWVFKLIILF